MMTPSQKIKQHASLDDLFASIEADKNSRDMFARRYPVRFILLDDFRMFKPFAEHMKVAGVSLVDLEKLRENDTDTWITRDELLGAIIPKRPMSCFMMVSPVSEIIRFYEREKFQSFLNEASLLENRNVTRIYIPFIGLRNRIEDFLTHYGRIKESAPVWAVGGSINTVQVFLLPSDTDTTRFELPERFERLNSFYEWLCFWKNRAPPNRVFFASDVLNAFCKNAQPDNIFQITKIANVGDFFEKVLNIHFPFEHVAEESVYWQRLLLENDWSTSRQFLQFAETRFNVRHLSASEIITNWIDVRTDDFGRWLLKKVALTTFASGTYLAIVFSENLDLHSGNALLGRVACAIVGMELTVDALQERRKTLELFPVNLPLSQPDENALADFIDKTAETNFDAALQLCTGRFCFECERFIMWFKDGKLTPERLKALYPAMADYLSEMECDEAPRPKTTAYFNAYKIAKLRDEYTPEIKALIEEYNASAETFWKWHSEFKSAHDLLAEADASANPIEKVFWLDGVGAEWLPLMLDRIKDSRFAAERVSLAAAKIPSTTENNRFSEGKIIKKDTLDKFAHESPYRYPWSICRELQIVRELMNEILSQTAWQKIAIVSDHGLSALSRLVDGRNYTRNDGHEGREEVVDAEGASDCYYIFKKANGQHYRVALKHASLGAKPVREVHGGCTPEEVLVPFIVIARKDNAVSAPHRTRAPSQPTTPTPKPQKRGFAEEDLF
jgi:hypothetical protein